MYLAIIVGQRTLWRVAQHASDKGQGPAPEAPSDVGSRNGLAHEARGNAYIDAEEPHIAREAVQHAAQERLLAREARHLPVGGVAEVGQHEQGHTHQVVLQIGLGEHPSGARSENIDKMVMALG